MYYVKYSQCTINIKEKVYLPSTPTFTYRLLSYIEEGGGYVGSAPPDEIEEDEVDMLRYNMASMNLIGKFKVASSVAFTVFYYT